MTVALAIAVLTASLVGSVHCAAMCGGFVCFYAGGDARTDWRAHVAYNVGRLTTYLALGTVAGLTGLGLERAGGLFGVGRAAALVAASLMILWGLASVAERFGVRLPSAPGAQWVAPRIAAAMRRVAALGAVRRAGAIGALTTLIPCGWLYAFAITAAGTGTVHGALLVMIAFWIGTLPVMLALGASARQVSGPLRRALPTASAIAVVVVGLVALAQRNAPPVKPPTHTMHVATPPTGAPDAR
ncbi:MAG: sulfite exporter TauE/SafE family protein [Gemmatimonadaceae bacterium]|nr:sulfite exporter TauE/SafE family protein [Gemmatimonadaceae bacterium]